MSSTSVPEMRTVPEGWFLMGTDPAVDKRGDTEEMPQLRIWLSRFEISRTPVTVGQWRAFLAATHYGWDFWDELATWSPTDQHPVVCVSWFDAMEYAGWLRQIQGGEWSLPTEAQWEKVCRGTKGALFPWGDEERRLSGDELEDHPIFDSNLAVGSEGYTSPFDCLDVWGNVTEWCLDWYDDEYYSRADRPDIDPTGPSSGGFVGRFRSIRGGSVLDVDWPRCAARALENPENRHPRIGFRVVRKGF